MIKTKAMYELYNMHLVLSIQQLQQKADNQRILVKDYLGQLNKIRHLVEPYIDYNDLLNGKIAELPKEFDKAIVDYTFNNIIVRNYYTLYSVLLKYENEVKELEKQKVKYIVYKTIINKFNAKMLKYCAETGKPYTNKYLGKLEVYYKEDTTQSVNWKQSNINKQEILARGGTPYLQKDEHKAKLEGREYHAEKWLVKGYGKGLLSWRWYVSDLIKNEIKREVYNYKFVPARGNFGAIQALRNVYANENHNYSIYK